MRMSPDYLIIGEVRDGAAAMSLFRALMTGHSGACTFHADSPREAARRLATVMGADAGVRAHEANQMIADAVDLLVQIGIRHETRRVVASRQRLQGTQKRGRLVRAHLSLQRSTHRQAIRAGNKLGELHAATARIEEKSR